MMRRQDGFSLVELMVALVVFVFAIAAATSIFIPLVNQFKQQTKIAETNIQGLVGLELLKTDLEQAGFGLPWYFPEDTIAYTEATVAPAGSTISGVTVNDAPNYAPRAVAAFESLSFGTSVNGNAKITGIVNGSDYLVIKSAPVGGTDAAQKWTYILSDPLNPANAPRVWKDNLGAPDPTQNPLAGDNVIVLRPKVADTRLRELVLDATGTVFSVPYSSTTFSSDFSPAGPPQGAYESVYLVYDIASGPLNMPFNRADYFVGIPNGTTSKMPKRCAQGTGILYKAVLKQDGTFDATRMTPLLDCVADMQVVFGLDMDNDGIIGTYSNADGSTVLPGISEDEKKTVADVQTVLLSHLDLSNYRSKVVEVRVYILAHEGQMDWNFTYPSNTILVGDASIGAAVGRPFDLSKLPDPNWQRYRWKVYTIVVKLQNMR